MKNSFLIRLASWARQVPEGGSGAAGGTPEASPSGSPEPSVSDILKFDMFGPSETNQPTTTPTPAPAEVPPAGQPTPQAPGQPPAASTPPTTPPAGDPGQPGGPGQPTAPATPPQQDLATLIADQTRAINEALNRGAQPPQQAPQPEQPPPPRFNVGVPPALVQMLRSEDETEVARGLHAMVNGVSNMVWDAVQKHIQENVLASIPSIVQSHHSATREADQIQQDFYGRYKHLNEDAFRPIVQNIGLSVYEEMKRAGLPTRYTPAVGDEIARRLHALIPALGPIPAAGGPPPAAPAAPAAPAVRPGKLNGAQGVRPGVTPEAALLNDIMEVVRA